MSAAAGRVAANLAQPPSPLKASSHSAAWTSPLFAAGASGPRAWFRQTGSGSADRGMVRCADHPAVAAAGRCRFPCSRRRREGTAARARRSEHAAAVGSPTGHRHHRRVAGLWRSARRHLQATPGSPPAYAVELQSQGIGFLALLQGADRQGRFDGKADLDLRAHSAGSKQRQLVQAWTATARSCCATGPSSASTSPACCARS